MDPDFKFRFSVRPVPDGEALTFAEIEERYLKQLEESERKFVQSLTELAKLYSHAKLHDEACRCIERLIALSTRSRGTRELLSVFGMLHGKDR